MFNKDELRTLFKLVDNRIRNLSKSNVMLPHSRMIEDSLNNLKTIKHKLAKQILFLKG
jgi:hypothetical protein